MEKTIKIYYWYCPTCGKDKTYTEVPSSKEALAELEKHEKEHHKGKPIGNFGVEFKKVLDSSHLM